jgi:hypothetical protein
MGSEKRSNDNRLAWRCATGLSVVAGLVRLVPYHPPNFTPVGALGLFGGARLRPWLAFTLPFAVMAVTDLALWGLKGYPAFDPFVYGSFLVNVLLGRWLLRQTNSAWRVGAVSLLASVQFFLVTNFGVWAAGRLYPKTPAGLALCYWEGLPFFGYTVAGDLFFAAVLFGLYAATLYVSERRKEEQPA